MSGQGRESAWSRFLRKVTRDYGKPRGPRVPAGVALAADISPACAAAGHHVVKVLTPGRSEPAGYYCPACDSERKAK